MSSRGYLPIRKYYGHDCVCEETQPRRGKNLPEGCLDSRAKKLHQQEKEDYEFTMGWLMENAHVVYKDERNHVAGLNEMPEVSLCKAHSSTLYRAKKRHERSAHQTPPSPTDSNATLLDDRQSQNQNQNQNQKQSQSQSQSQSHVYHEPYKSTHYSHLNYSAPYSGLNGGLAAKVREISQDYRQSSHDSSPSSPDFSAMEASTSIKRKRITKQLDQKPYSSASTPLYATGVAPLLSTIHQPPSSSTSPSSAHRHTTISPNFSSQLPPLHSRTASVSSLSIYSRQHGPVNSASAPPLSLPNPCPTIVETVSLKSIPSPTDPQSLYYLRNLVITDTFTFRDLLAEVDMTGSPPPGKRIVVSDARNERTFPLDQAIRSVIKRPFSSHVELCIGLANKTSIDWSTYV
ncbi:hypothetical protein PHYBLDRAFT_184535 [Phycomyces blakesleeanus NRRL 1555(-)]|uniref:Uncharacterized protein n=1 Tax=Phycomyces blakesleeanus (strain ATCC 8743b / DSM 1359 / FGSC 10004 / NBRC 33097 / NRRL 1555) TaxID=763407 RepID=A0A167R7W6_PHYB8|nr:hypothetical protein PHYBLDRAFT_184535 [Phycomyces blakesleeanus NRRL 1555(-)]OAD81058.1 hypothetical protein PHYBLDRAFT_184535 [Phycomyces blakesleeanus NRRL 1555(-)]|eukprot:XP_018299098.1 hypothetical protein PHYBLDRAFT_184535 [Phycomyces blakesleeanus NRRL 1555(-)]